MPYTISWKAKGIVWTYYGVLTGSDLLESNFRIFGDERFDNINYQIADLTRVETFELTEAHMRKIAHLDMAASRSNPNIKVAVVTTAEVGLELVRVYEKHITEKSAWETSTFASLEEAEAWLGIENQ